MCQSLSNENIYQKASADHVEGCRAEPFCNVDNRSRLLQLAINTINEREGAVLRFLLLKVVIF